MRQPDISLCVCVRSCVCSLADIRCGGEEEEGWSCPSHSLTHTSISYKRAWMVIQLQPALSKQVKEKKRRRRMRDEVSGQKQHGGLVCPPHPDERPRQILCEWEHILKSYTSHFSLRRKTETCRKGDAWTTSRTCGLVVWWGAGASARPCRPLSLSAISFEQPALGLQLFVWPEG